jgi:PKD repeat protein
VTVKEGETIKLDYKVTDADGTQDILSYSGWMKGATYTTTYDDAGEHQVTVTAEDGQTKTTKIVTITVENVNRAPVLKLDHNSVSVVELDTLSVKATASDPDGDRVTISYGSPLSADGSWTPKLNDAGTYDANVTASDGSLATTVPVRITVTPANRPPTITVPGEDGKLHVKEGDLIDLSKLLVIADQENEKLTVTYSGWMKSSTYQTTYDDAGSHDVTVSASDESRHTTTKTVTIVVDDVNRPPVFTVPV